MTWFDLPRALREELLEDDDLVGLVGDRIHYQELPESSVYPHVWFTRTSRDQSDCVTGEEEMRIERFAIEIVGEADLEAVVDRVVELLEAFARPVGDRYVQLVEVEDADDDYVFKSVGEGEPDYLHALTVAVYSFDA